MSGYSPLRGELKEKVHVGKSYSTPASSPTYIAFKQCFRKSTGAFDVDSGLDCSLFASFQ